MHDRQLLLDIEDTTWRKFAAAAIRDLAATGHSFTVDDVRDLVEPMHLTPADPRAYGLLMKAEALAGSIRSTEQFRRSRHATRGGRWVMVWIGERAA